MRNWQPSAAMPVLRARAELLDRCRRFFSARGVLEVVTPSLSRCAGTEPNIVSLEVSSSLMPQRQLYLHSSPEFPMKRLLAAGAGAIYQICTVYRDCDHGRQHRPEFSMLEWYRPGWDYRQLMQEVEALINTVMEPECPPPGDQLDYRQLYRQYAGLDPFSCDATVCRNCCAEHSVTPPDSMNDELDPWLDLIMSTIVAAGLPQDRLTFIYDYPPSQAALARTREREGTLVAERFEAYWGAMELANGFQELTDAGEQVARFTHENELRQMKGLPMMPIDDCLLQALESGMPDCAGVALGMDRLLMLVTGKQDIAEVITFDDTLLF